MPDLTAARPAEPFADAKARVAAAVEAARDEILELSHRIHANPEPAFEERQASAWVADGLRGPRLRGRAPGRQPRRPRSGPCAAAVAAATARGSGSSPSTTRCPGWVTAAATTRWPHPGVGAAIALAADRRRAARRDRVPRHARRGAGERQADHDRRRAVRGPRRGAAVPPVRPQPRREPSRSRRRTSTSCSRPAGARLVRPVEGQERARRDDPAVHLGRAVAPAAAARPSRVHGIIREGGTAANIIPDRASAWFMLRSDDQRLLRGR